MRMVLAILRAEQFSPNSVEKDKAIMMAVVERLRSQSYTVEVVSEDLLSTVKARKPELVLSMGRLPETLCWLKTLDARVVNSPEGVARCQRSVLERIMKENAVPMPPEKGSDGYWLKRGDTAAQTKGDVVYAADEEELKKEIDTFHQRGIENYTVSAHVVGDVVKFYGILPSQGDADNCRQGVFFRY